ncbi:MAG: hypothetical protein LUF82_01650 [Clostridia bacterium]|nr:hypothetical protein [Clostridia bacterium]
MVDFFDEDRSAETQKLKYLKRVGRLLYIGEYESAKFLIQSALIQYPDDIRLLEYENTCLAFCTRNFENYLIALSKRTAFYGDDYERFIIEIDSFCAMISCKADKNINVATYRRQNIENYSRLLTYIGLLKRSLQNDCIIACEELYISATRAFLKMTATVCNTIYTVARGKRKNYRMLISLETREILEKDFNLVKNNAIISNYSIVGVDEIKNILGESL